MSSTSTTYIGNINTAFPVAGVDNDTQGFRDNYANIKNGLTALANEVTSIQTDGAFITQTNDFGDNIIQNVQVQALSNVVSNNILGTIGGNQTIDFSLGNYHRWKITSSTNFSFANFPSVVSTLPTVRLELFRDPLTTSTVSVTLLNNDGPLLLDTAPNAPVSNPIALTTSSPVVYEISRSINSSNTGSYLVRFVGGPFIE